MGLLISSFPSPLNRSQRILRDNPPDGTSGVARLQNFAVWAEGEIGCVDDAAVFFPVGADSVGVYWDFEAVADRKRRAGASDHFLGFIEWVDGQGDDVDVFFLECFKVRLIVGNLPNAVGSPDAAVVDDDGVFGFEVAGNV